MGRVLCALVLAAFFLFSCSLADTVLPIQPGVFMIGTEGNGEHSIVALDPSGDLYMWGSNREYQFGNGSSAASYSPVHILSGVAKVTFSTDGRMYALLTDGTLMMWGTGWYGKEVDSQLLVKTPTKILDNIIDVAAAGQFTIVLDAYNDAYVWGNCSDWNGNMGLGSTHPHGLYMEPQFLKSSISRIFTGRAQGLLIDFDNQLWFFGNNENGQAGNGNLENVYEPTLVTDNVLKAVGGGAHTLVLKQDGTVMATGYSHSGQISWIYRSWYNSEYRQISENAKEICTGEYSSYVILNNNELWTCGFNDVGQLGLGVIGDQAPLQYIMDDVIYVGACAKTAVVVTSNGQMYVTGYVADFLPETSEVKYFMKLPYNFYGLGD